MEQRPCSCGGSNENCTRCYGRGFIEGAAHSVLPKRRTSKKKNVAAQTSNVSRARRADVSSLASTASGPPPQVSCPLCKCRIREDRLRPHLNGRCPLRRNKNRYSAPGPVMAAHGIAAVFRRLSISTSSPRKPQQGAGRKTRGAASEANMSPESRRHKGNLEVERPEWWNNLDATKDRGYPARETGRCGSYPSHDGFDDESKP
jgi:hypothetical protein